jgi:tungsten cofactor oxidoreducase radical SAM maturase
MPKVKMSNGRGIILPGDFLERRHIQLEREYWLDARNGELILHPCLPDIYKLYIEPTTACNLKCRTCIRNTWDDPNQHMSMRTFQRIVDSLDGLPDLRRVVFTSFGEPFTQPRILDMIEAMRKRNLAVTIGTNGLLLNSKVSSELIKLGVDRVMISIDGGKPETYAGVRGAMLAEVIEHLRGLNEAKQRLQSLYPAIGIEFVALRSNVAELDDLVKMAAELNVSRLLVSNVLAYTEELREEVLYGYQPVPPFKASGWALKLGAWVSWATLELPRMHWGAERRCRFVQDHAIVVGWDGCVSPCYALSHNYSYFTVDGVKKHVERYILGNVNDQSLVDVWTSEDYVRFRSEVKVYHFPSCPDCDLRESCDLRANNNGCWGWNPSCADCLWAQGIIRCP